MGGAKSRVSSSAVTSDLDNCHKKTNHQASDDDDNDDVVVVENGSYHIKAGFADGDHPRTVFPSVVGTLRTQNSIGAKRFVGDEAEHKYNHGSLDLEMTYPIDHGIVQNWDDMQTIWHHTFYNEVRVEPEEYPVLLTEPPNNPKLHREKMTQIMFETFKTPAMYVACEGPLSLFGWSVETGIALNSGHTVTHIIPVYKHHSIPHACMQLDIGGRDINNHLGKLLEERYPNYPINTSIVSDIKERFCYVTTSANSNDNTKSYECANGKHITIDKEQWQCPEVLFNPSLVGINSPGIHELCYQSVMKCGEEIRKEIYANILVSGGNTMFSGIADRLHEELTKLAPSSTNIKIIAPPARQHITWLGGSLLGCSSHFPQMWISKQEYDENGANIVHRKCL